MSGDKMIVGDEPKRDSKFITHSEFSQHYTKLIPDRKDASSTIADEFECIQRDSGFDIPKSKPNSSLVNNKGSSL